MPTPAANAAALMAMVYYTAKISGGHLNPALTATFALLGYTNPIEVLVYWASQVSGCLVGALLISSLSSDLEIGGLVTQSTTGSGCFIPNPSLTALQVLGWEATCTFSFILPIFSVVWYTQSKSGYGNTGPIIVGLSLFAAASAASPWTGGALNPARVLASHIVFDCGPNNYVEYYIAGEFIGAFLVPIAVIPWYGISDDIKSTSNTPRLESDESSNSDPPSDIVETPVSISYACKPLTTTATTAQATCDLSRIRSECSIHLAPSDIGLVSTSYMCKQVTQLKTPRPSNDGGRRITESGVQRITESGGGARNETGVQRITESGGGARNDVNIFTHNANGVATKSINII